MPAIHWIENFSKAKTAAHKKKAKRSFAMVLTIWTLPELASERCRVLINGWKDTQTAKVQAHKATYLWYGNERQDLV